MLVIGPGVTDVVGNRVDPIDNRVSFAAAFENVRTDGVLAHWANVNANDRSWLTDSYSTVPLVQAAPTCP